MLFMAIFTYEPENRDRVIERRLESKDAPKKVNIRGQWYDVSGHRVFCLFEATDAAHVAALFYDWTDLGIAELIPVVETEFVIKLLKRAEHK